jgi:hypothetical protein
MQAANEVQQAIVTENVLVSNAVSQQLDGNNAVGNKEHQDQNPGVTTNQETTIASSTVDVPVTSCTSEPKSEEKTQISKCEIGT